MEIQKLGPYRLGKRIGKGGMGSVYAAVEEGTGAKVAVKALSPQLAMSDGFRERFEAEIDSLKILDHENIVHLLGFGEDRGILFYSMELIDGPSLEQELISGRRFDWRETIDIAVQVCRGLKQAHDHGVVHRDIKPANLLLTEEQKLKIADFGIARLFGATQLTSAGGILGTADYMSPEQAEGNPVTEKCDQYSLGSVMYALLAGRPPFRAKSMPEMLQMQRFAEPELVTRYAPQTPKQLSSLIQQLLSKDPNDRFPNVLVLGRSLAATEKALSRPPQPEEEESRSEPKLTLGKTAADQSDETLLHEETYLPGDESIDLDIPEEIYDAPTVGDLQGDIELEEPEPQTLPASGAPTTDSLHAEPVVSGPTAATPTTGIASRFTTVDEEARQRRREQGESRLALFTQVVGLLATLAVVIGTGWWLLRPPTAEQLYSQIQTKLEEQGDKGVRVVRDEVADFQRRFPDDPRQQQLEGIRDELELERLAVKLRGQSRYAKRGTLHPIEQLYGEAIALEKENPALAAQMLKSLVDLYAEAPTEDSNPEQQQWIALAERQLKKLQEETAAISARQLPLLEERLAQASDMRETSPAAARRIYKALIALYEQKPWAASVVGRARTELKGLSEE